ncbi:nitroreductase family deazaflavin-dependent oxidoreductase [Streptomyces sp. NPDC037389]|uniref:nitroreductase family deazaflavin-dependent oxidoreductase n=1 Tax=Streptomyces sp. NPDC037389 TaxID=3155369 RepID=UPI003409BAF7
MATVERLVQRISSTRSFARFAPHVVPSLDRAVHRLTGGKVLLSTRLLPSCLLTSTGAKSGLPRRAPLACMPLKGEDGTVGAWVLVGSNFGRPGHPAWSANLLKHPDAVISWKGQDVPVGARLLKGAEREAMWAAVVRFWPPYARYQERVEREIRLFRLERR